MSSDYLDNKRFEELILLYRSGDKSIDDELARAFLILAKMIFKKYRFEGWTTTIAYNRRF